MLLVTHAKSNESSATCTQSNFLIPVAAAITRVEWGTLGDVGGSGTDWFRYIHLRTSPHHHRRRTGSPGSPDLLGMLHHV